MKVSELVAIRRGTVLLAVILSMLPLFPRQVEGQGIRERLRQAAEAAREGLASVSCAKNDNLQCASPISLGAVASGVIGPNNRDLYYRFVVERAGIVQLSLNPMPNQKGVRARIMDEQQQVLTDHQFDRGEPGDRVVQFVTPGTYYMRLQMNGGGGADERFSVVLREDSNVGGAVPVVAQSGCSRNGTFQCASTLTMGSPVAGVIGGNNRELYYRVAVDRAGVVQVALNPMPNQKGVRVQMTDANYQRVADHMFDRGQPGVRTTPITAPGNYYVMVQMNGGGGLDEQFGLVLTHAPEATATVDCAQNGTYQCAEPLAIGDPLESVIGGTSRDLYYRVDIDQPGMYRVAMLSIPTQLAVQVTVADSDYNQVERFSFEGGTPGAQEVRLATPGTYYLRAYTPNTGSAERFSLQISRIAP